MFARYARDLFIIRDFFNEKNKNIRKLNNCIIKTAHNKLIDYVFKYAGAIALLNSNDAEYSICESGSSLYGFIEEVIAMDHVFEEANNINKIMEAAYIGSDISEMMNRGAAAFHSNMRLSFSKAPTVNELMDELEHIGLFYGLSISLRYALRTASDLIKISNKSDLAAFNRISLSYEGNKQIKAGTGKYAYVMSIPEMKNLFKENNITAKFTTENMQKNKDGENTIRVSIVFSKK